MQIPADRSEAILTVIRGESMLIDVIPSASQVPEASTFQDPNTEVPIELQPAPAYGGEYGKVDFEQDGFDTKAKVASKHPYNFQ